jgi:hypothetical protein
LGDFLRYLPTEQVRAFVADVLGMPSVCAGEGWLIFALLPAELVIHPADGESHHALRLICDDIQATLAELRGKGRGSAGCLRSGLGLLATICLPEDSRKTAVPGTVPGTASPTGRHPAIATGHTSYEDHEPRQRQIPLGHA